MQLIVESEAVLDIKRDMSDIEDIHTEKVVNGDIEQLIEKKCNGNKEHIDVISNDEKNKQVLNTESEANFPMDVKPENTKEESDVKIVNTEDTCEATIPETNGKQKEESQSNGTDAEIRSTSPIIKESEEKPKEVVEEAIIENEETIVEHIETIVEDEEAILEDDIISLKHENLDQIPDIVEKESEKVEPKTDEIKNCEDLSATKDNVDGKETPDDTHTKTETVPDVVLDEPVPDVKLKEINTKKEENSECSESKDKPEESSENKDKPEESSENKDKPEESSENKDKLVESSENKDKLVESSENKDKLVESSENKDKLVESSENKDKLVESSENKDKLVESSENKDKLVESTENKDEPEVSSENKHKPEKSSENKEKDIEIKELVCNSTEVISNNNARATSPIELKDDMDVEEIVETEKTEEQVTAPKVKEKPSTPVSSINPVLCKLSNTLDILSDDEDESPKEETPKVEDLNEKQCINIEDDDDIMLIDEDTTKTETPQPVDNNKKEDAAIETEDKSGSETKEEKVEETVDLFTKTEEKDQTQPEVIKDQSLQINISEKQEEVKPENFSTESPLLPGNFLKSAKKNLSDMTREELEEFCILKIVESIVDRSNLSEIKNKLKTVAQGVDEYRKKVMMLTKQNRDLQVVLKSIQEEQKKSLPGTPITPLKITRSVGMQVFMEKTGARRKNLAQLQNSTNTRQGAKNLPGPNLRPQKPPASTQSIPVPRLVPASPAIKSPSTIPLVNQITPSKPTTPIPNGVKNPTPQKAGDKRQHNRIMSVTVDLTDDEPPTKMNNRTSPAPPVRVVPSQNLMANPRQPFPAAVSSPRKVYIPISGPQNQNVRPGQTIMLKTVPTPGLRARGPSPQVVRQPTGAVRMNRVQANRHPAPLPDAMKQYQPPNWKALPPAPDLKLSKVENGIVISWKIEGYQEDSYEEIASYQLYAYQETSSPPSTSLWKKIGDVKALPLPMACTLTQFMAGFKYFFAVRAVDIRSRLGPFSLPGSILLLNKL